MTNSKKSPFARLLELQPTDQLRERLHNIRQHYALPDDDSLWTFTCVVLEYCRIVQECALAQGASTCLKTTTRSPSTFEVLVLGNSCRDEFDDADDS